MRVCRQINFIFFPKRLAGSGKYEPKTMRRAEGDICAGFSAGNPYLCAKDI